MAARLVPLCGILLYALPAYADQPIVIDTVGTFDTDLRAHTTTARPPTWVPEFAVIIKFAGWSSDDVLSYQLKKGRKKIGPAHKCKASTNVKEAKAERSRNKKQAVDLVYFACKPDDKFGVKKGGQYSLELSYKQTLQGKTFDKFATLHMGVIEALHGNHRKPYKHFVEDNDIRMGTTVLYEKVTGYSRSRAFGMLADAAARHTGLHTYGCFAPGIEIRTWYKQDENSFASKTKMTCLYKGKKVDEDTYSGGLSRDYWSYKRKGKSDRIKRKWVQVRYQLKKLRPDPACGWDEYKAARRPMRGYWLSKNPGDYRCVITADGDIIKEVYFTVGADGKIAKDPCNAKINTLRHVAVVATKVKKSATVRYNKKLANKYAFSRAEWGKSCPPRKK